MMASNSGAGRLNELGRPSESPTTNGNSLDERIGPFYDTKTVAERLKRSRSTVYRLMARREILGLRTSDNKLLFPIWQFDTDGEVPKRLSEVLAAMDPGLNDGWGDALWLFSPAAFLDVDRPIDRIRQGDLDEVLSVATRIGAARNGDGSRPHQTTSNAHFTLTQQPGTLRAANYA